MQKDSTSISEIVRTLEEVLNAIEKTAFSIPASNGYTPEIVHYCIVGRNALIELKSQSKEVSDVGDINWPDNICADRHETSGKWVLHYLTDEQAALCKTALATRHAMQPVVIRTITKSELEKASKAIMQELFNSHKPESRPLAECADDIAKAALVRGK